VLAGVVLGGHNGVRSVGTAGLAAADDGGAGACEPSAPLDGAAKGIGELDGWH